MKKLQQIISLGLVFLALTPSIFCMEDPTEKKATRKKQRNTLVPSLIGLSICALDENTFPRELQSNINLVADHVSHVNPRNFTSTISLIHENLNFRAELGEQSNSYTDSPAYFELKPYALFLACAKASGKQNRDFYKTTLGNPQDIDELKTQLGKHLFTCMIKNTKSARDNTVATRLVNLLSEEDGDNASVAGESDMKYNSVRKFIDEFHMRHKTPVSSLDNTLSTYWGNQCMQWNKKKKKLSNGISNFIEFSTGFLLHTLAIAPAMAIAMKIKTPDNSPACLLDFVPCGLYAALLCATMNAQPTIANKIRTVINNKIAFMHHYDPAILNPNRYNANELAVIAGFALPACIFLTWAITKDLNYIGIYYKISLEPKENF